MHDVSVNMTRLVALCLKIQGQQNNKSGGNDWSEDLSESCIQISKSELSEEEVTTVMQVM